VVVAASIVIAAALGTFLYFELNKVKLPNASEFARTSITKMTKKLEKQGLSVRIKGEFNKRKRGSFLRLDGTNPGNSVLKFNPVTIVQSKGPGVPSEGIVGKKVGSVTKVLKKMGVEVKVHNVVVDNKPTGEVIGSEPMPGYSVINGNKGVINLAVASKNKGIPVNIFGMDKDKAKEKLNSLGFNDITLKPHFAS
ncbi:serine/threonine protein kinase, partial [Bifidobacteriaceae bacterium NR003]